MSELSETQARVEEIRGWWSGEGDESRALSEVRGDWTHVPSGDMDFLLSELDRVTQERDEWHTNYASAASAFEERDALRAQVAQLLKAVEPIHHIALRDMSTTHLDQITERVRAFAATEPQSGGRSKTKGGGT